MSVVSAAWTHPDALSEPDHVFASGHAAPVVRVTSIHALNQFVGYVKYKSRSTHRVFFRGQWMLYDYLVSSVYRNKDGSPSIGSRNSGIVRYIEECTANMEIVKGLPPPAREPLLQHYGIHTRWLDVVDNLWLGLWFGLHRYERRFLDRDYQFVYERDDDEWQYLLLMGCDAAQEDSQTPGLFLGPSTKLIDLRGAVPSTFLRPHCQHALLLSPKVNDTLADIDLSANVEAVVKVHAKHVKDWLGNGRLISAENVYPSPVYDLGYCLLLEQAPHNKHSAEHFGSITSITYGMPSR